ncbi:MAG: hypothetical protein ACFCUG_01610 [Thiotrichales bacterium]
MAVIRNFLISAGLLACAVGFSAVALAGTPFPNIPPAKGEECVEPTADIRKNHMKYLMHQRDATVHLGIRTKAHSLKGCIDCHVQPDDQGGYPALGSSEHFCSSCHNYAAVSIDCFQCHAHKPDNAIGKPHVLPRNAGSAIESAEIFSAMHGRLSQLNSVDTRDE